MKDIRERLSLSITPDEYQRIRRLWIDHSKAEDARDLNGLVATMAPNAVYQMVLTGERWEGHAGVREFYTTMLGALPDVHFDLEEIVIGPQGVFEVATVTGTQKGRWAGRDGDDSAFRSTVQILFPWDAEQGLFLGERIWNMPLSPGGA